MRAKKEFEDWIASDEFETSDSGEIIEEAYITGFNRAIALMEEFLKDKQGE